MEEKITNQEILLYYKNRKKKSETKDVRKDQKMTPRKLEYNLQVIIVQEKSVTGTLHYNKKIINENNTIKGTK